MRDSSYYYACPCQVLLGRTISMYGRVVILEYEVISCKVSNNNRPDNVLTNADVFVSICIAFHLCKCSYA